MKLIIPMISILFSFQAFAIVHGKYFNEGEVPAVKRLVLIPEKDSLDIKKISTYGRCTGVAISDSILITAGHCVSSDAGASVPHVVELTKQQLKVTAPNKIITDYIPEDRPAEINNGPVPGCSQGKKDIFESKTLDLAIIAYPEKTFKHFVKIDFLSKLNINDKILFYGFGTIYNSFEIQMPIPLIHKRDLGVAEVRIDRVGITRAATVSNPLEPFADIGDSGGPVIRNGH